MDCPFCKGPTALVSDSLGGHYRCEPCDEEFQLPDQIQNGLGRRFRARIATLEAERDFYRDREKRFAEVLGVADGGQYRADWDARLEGIVAERDRLRELVRAMRRECSTMPVCYRAAKRVLEETGG